MAREGAAALVAVVADMHSGHRAALPWGEEPWALEDGSELHVNAVGQQIWRHWEECWGFVGERRRKLKARLIVTVNGDSIEGDHYRPPGVYVASPEQQGRMHESAMLQGLDEGGFQPKRDHLVYIAGTAPAHEGDGNEWGEAAARGVCGGPLDGRRLTPRLLARVNGVLFDVAHTGLSDGRRPWLFGNGIRAGLREMWEDCRDAGQPMPRYVVRSHRHVPRVGDLRDRDGRIASEGFITGAWKLKDDHIYQRMPAAFARIGMLVFEVGADGESTFHPLYMTVLQDEIIEL